MKSTKLGPVARNPVPTGGSHVAMPPVDEVLPNPPRYVPPAETTSTMVATMAHCHQRRGNHRHRCCFGPTTGGGGCDNSDHELPSHHLILGMPDGSGYQPGGGVLVIDSLGRRQSLCCQILGRR